MLGRGFERHKTILKVASKNFKNRNFLDFEYGSGFARLLKNIKNGAFDIFYSNTIKLH